MKNALIILSVILFNTSIFGQDLVQNYKWETKPNYKVNKELAEDYAAVILLDHRIKAFYGGKNQKPLAMSHVNHFAVKIIAPKAIEKYNRVYVPSYGKLMEIKARTIKPDGSVINLGKDKMKKIEDKRYGGYTIFALEGVDKGDIVEYMYKRTLRGDYCGIEIFQKDVPIQAAKLEILSTSIYDVDTKSYYGLSKFETRGNNHRLISITKNIPAIPDEGFSSSLNDYRMRAAYRVKKLIAPDRREFPVITWPQVAQNFSDFKEVVKIKGAKKLFKQLGLTASMSDDKKIMILEQYIKENFTLKRDRSADADKFKNILKNKYGNEVDLTRAMQYLTQQLRISSHWIISTNKSYIKVDPDFPNTQGLREHILYFQSTKKYVAMGRQNMRYGPPPASVIGNYGLVINNMGSIQKIEYNASDYSMQDIKAKVTFNEDFSVANIDKTVLTSGFRAIGIRAALNSGRAEIVKNITHNYTTNYMGDTKVLEVKIENEGFDQTYENVPVAINAKIEANELIEDTEDFYIFSLGKIIGQQNELYQEKERVTPVEIDYPLAYFTTIEIVVPDGYTVSGLKDCTIKNECNDKTDVIAGFESSATQEGNIVTVKLYEFYHKLYYPKEIYEDYRKVINSAADFNKLVLIFQKE